MSDACWRLGLSKLVDWLVAVVRRGLEDGRFVEIETEDCRPIVLREDAEQATESGWLFSIEKGGDELATETEPAGAGSPTDAAVARPPGRAAPTAEDGDLALARAAPEVCRRSGVS